MAASCPTRRSRRCSTTTRGAIHWCSPFTSGIQTDRNRGTIWNLLNRQKDIQYSSRAVTHIKRQKQLHRLRHVVSELVKRMPETERRSNTVRELAEYGCLTRMHVVRLLAPAIDGEDHTKDIDFSPSGVQARWTAGYDDTRRLIAKAPWEGDFDPIEGFILHEAHAGAEVTSG
jgi:NTE family protein